ncbi:MAG: selenium cofactor biosynthesis protein YqeC, partial [Chloroflexota bacterium]|nr:selenium cofactor biosynthesis protein YqeC [Chloroflexota bacterium]
QRALDQHKRCLVIGEVQAYKVRGIAPERVDQLVAQAAGLNVAAVLIEADGSRWLPFKAPAAHEPVLPTSTTLLIPVMGLDALGAPIDDTHVHRAEQVRRLLGLAPDDATTRLTPQMVARLLVHAQGGAKALPAGARLLPLLNKAETVTRLASARLVAHQLAGAGYGSLIGAVGVNPANPIIERWSPLAAVVLAAGQSRRMGRAKQLEIVDGEAMVVRAVRTALQSEVATVLVVTGAYADAVAALLSPLLAEAGDRLRLVHNPDWQSGQASSIRTAIQMLSASALLPGERFKGHPGARFAAALFTPTDQPFAPATLLRQLICRWRSGARLAAPLVDEEVRGAPALFDRSLWPELLTLQGDVGARPLLQKYHAEVVTVPTPAELLRDIDTPQDLV